MIDATEQLINELHSPVRQIVGKVELYNGSTLTETFTHNGVLKSFTVERAGEQTFFGFGVCHKLTVKITDVTRQKVVPAGGILKVYITDITPYPLFHITETQRDENSGDITLIAYDNIYTAANYQVSQLVMTAADENTQNYTVLQFATACAGAIGAAAIKVEGVGAHETCFNTYYELGANFEGTETIREALDAVAEATQTIYFLNADNQLVFKRLDKDGDAVYTINKSMYFELSTGVERKLASIYHVTELGDNVSSSTGEGAAVYVRDNPFWDMYTNVAVLVSDALAAVGGLAITDFTCDWRGNFLLEIGDKIGLITKDDTTIYSYVLNDSISYTGALSETTQWEYSDNENETPSNPTSVGDTLKQTYAKVDKINKEVQLVASDTTANKEAISSLQININNISTTVKEVETATNDAIDGINEQLKSLSTKIEQTSENVKIEVLEELTNGTIGSVTTSTGFTFDDEGLTVEKTDSDMSTLITEDGMTVSYKDEEMLVANSEGVKAANLHATTYLIIGKYSRFEDYEKDGEPRTGCFWIGQ